MKYLITTISVIQLTKIDKTWYYIISKKIINKLILRFYISKGNCLWGMKHWVYYRNIYASHTRKKNAYVFLGKEIVLVEIFKFLQLYLLRIILLMNNFKIIFIYIQAISKIKSYSQIPTVVSTPRIILLILTTNNILI